MNREDVLDAATWAVTRAKKHLDYIEFSCEDASRSDWDYMVDVCSEVIRAGATVINLPDTTGHAIPEEFGRMFAYMREKVPGADKVIWSAHCHNDLGLAVANSLAAVRNGARQIECTINGIGERAGNCSMEEVVMAMKTRHDLMGVQFARSIRARSIRPRACSRRSSDSPVPANKPIVGDNAFAHEAGIHQDGVLKYKLTYEIMKPEDIGIPSNKLVLGKHSGRHAFTNRLEELGVDIDDVDVNKAFAEFKALCDKKKIVYDDDILALVTESARRTIDHFELVDLKCRARRAKARRMRKSRCASREKSARPRAKATGWWMRATRRFTKSPAINPALERYAVKAITGGTDALGEVSCMIRENGVTVAGQGAHSDIVMASALALVNALNRLKARKHAPLKPTTDVR